MSEVNSKHILKNIVFRCIYQKAFKCQKCGLCCQDVGVILLHEIEIEKIADFLGMDYKNFIKKYTKKMIEKMIDPRGKKNEKKIKVVIKTDPCIFYNRETGCTIHSVKPKACKAFPFLTGFGPELLDKDIFLNVNCPGAYYLNEAVNAAKQDKLKEHPEYIKILGEMGKIYEKLQKEGLIDEEGNILSFDFFRAVGVIEEIFGFTDMEEAKKWLE